MSKEILLRRYSDQELGILDVFMKYYTNRIRGSVDVPSQALRGMFNSMITDVNIAIEDFKYDIVIREDV